jgi:hypothetical protein
VVVPRFLGFLGFLGTLFPDEPEELRGTPRTPEELRLTTPV